MEKKICNKCNKNRELSLFDKHHNSKDGLRKTCNICLGTVDETVLEMEKDENMTRPEKRREKKKNVKAAKKINKMLLTDEDKALRRLLTDFPTFVSYTYGYLGLPSITPLQNRISTILGENPERLIMQAARGTGKSWITGIYAAWRLLRNKDEKILIISGTATLAEKISKFVRSLLTVVPLLNHLEPKVGDADSTSNWNVHGCKTAIEVSVSALGIGGQIVGKRATLVIADDVEIPANSGTQTMREKLLDTVKEFTNILIPDVPNTSVLFLGTPQSMESIYSKLPFPMTILPATVPMDISIYKGNLDPWILEQGPAGTPTDKIRFTEEVLATKLADIGLNAYMLQYNLDTSLSDADKYPLKTKDLIIMPLNKERGPLLVNYGVSHTNVLNELQNVGFNGDRFYKPSYVSEDTSKYDTIVMGIDPAGDGSDETAWAVIGVLNGNVFVLHVGASDKGYSDQALMEIALVAKKYKVNEIIPEKNMGNGMFGALLEKMLAKVYPISIYKDFTSKGQKEVRIVNNLLPLMTNHNLIVDYDVVLDDVTVTEEGLTLKSQSYSLFYQLTRLTRDKGALEHDDRLDALAIAIEYIKDMVLVDAETVIKQLEKLELEEWLNEKIYGNNQFSNNSNNKGSSW